MPKTHKKLMEQIGNAREKLKAKPQERKTFSAPDGSVGDAETGEVIEEVAHVASNGSLAPVDEVEDPRS